MDMPHGSEIYILGDSPVVAYGLTYSNEELDIIITGAVSQVIFDDVGTVELDSLLGSLADTNFASGELKRILTSDHEPENWRVGEAMAEAYLTVHRDCHFPWPNGRDQKKESSSLPGTDLVGFQQAGVQDDRFAFGEVKTSDHDQYPPSVMYGRHGLKQQLEDLRDYEKVRDSLVKYLGHRAAGSPWERQYKTATSRYLRNSSDVSLFGLLIRDVEPHEDDLRARVKNIATDCPSDMIIELIAIYLPTNSIDQLGAKIMACRRGDAS